jgi:hypothetical protein
MSPVPVHRPAADPTVLTLLAADGLHRDSLGKFYILGVFSGINAPAFPALHPPVALYVALTDGYGTVTVTLRLVRAANEDHALFSGEFKVEFHTPLDVVETGLSVPAIRLPAPGEYRWQVVCRGAVLYEHRLIVSRREREPGR